jgi:hypothetical protein
VTGVVPISVRVTLSPAVLLESIHSATAAASAAADSVKSRVDARCVVFTFSDNAK